MEFFLSTWQLMITALITLAITLYFYSHSANKEHKKHVITKTLPPQPPQVSGGLPILGHLFELSGPKPVHIVLSDMSEKYGPIFTIRLGQRLGLVINNSEVARECYKTNDIAFCHRPQTAAMGLMGYNYAMLGFSNYGAYWREMRKISVLRLLSNRKVHALGPVRVSEIREMIKSIYHKCEASDLKSLDMRKHFGDLTIGLMVRTVAGEVEKNLDSREKEKWRKTIREFFKMMTVFTVSDVVSSLKWFDSHFGRMHKAFVRTGKDFDAMLQEWLDEHKAVEKKRSSREVKEEEDDFMTEMLRLSDDVSNEFPAFDADTVNKATCQTMMVGGTDTMTVTLIWTLSLLLNNRRALDKAQQELDEHVGRGRVVQESDIENLPYIQAVIKESMRLQPPVPVTPRETSEDCAVSGFHVPAKTFVFVNNWKIQRDPNVWPEPLEFRPERFLTTHREVDVSGTSFELVPFGGGRRVCPAVVFAIRSMQLALASFLQAFEVDTPFGEAVDMEGSFGTTNLKAKPLEVCLNPRLSAELYA